MDDIKTLLKAYKADVRRSGVLDELRQRECYFTPSEKRRRKRYKAEGTRITFAKRGKWMDGHVRTWL